MFELAVVLALVFVNALLSGVEMAVVSARRSRLQAAADAGSRRARCVLQLRHDPERFLATVQVGITLVSAVAAAFGGASLAAVLTPSLARVPGLETSAPQVAFVLVVALITYLSVVFGELIPKSLALRHAVPIALAMARPVMALEFVARPLVWLLVRSSNVLLRPFHDSTNFVESKLSREDLAAMVDEATSQSDLPPATRQVLERALEFATLRLNDVMVHRRRVVSLAKNADTAAIRQAMVGAGHRRVPVHDGRLDEIVGYVLRDDVMALLWDGQPIDLAALLRPAYFVPDTMPADRALQEMQRRRLHLAIVVDEHGGLCGIVTLEDLLEELVGEIFNERDASVADTMVRDADGAWTVQGSLDVREFARSTGLDLEAPDDVRSMGGLIVHLAGGSLPAKGTRFDAGAGIELEAVEVSQRRVRSLRVRVRTPEVN